MCRESAISRLSDVTISYECAKLESPEPFSDSTGSLGFFIYAGFVVAGNRTGSVGIKQDSLVAPTATIRPDGHLPEIL